MITFTSNVVVFWLLTTVGLSNALPTIIVNYDDEYEYSYSNNIGFIDTEDNEFSGEAGSGETMSFSPEKCTRKKLLNIDEAEELSEKDKSYLSYLDIIQRLNRTINYTADPCTDFYEYACGNSKRDADVFEQIKQQNDWKIIETIEAFNFSQPQDSFVNKAKRYYESCTATYNNLCNNSTTTATFQSILHKFSAVTGLQFPASRNVNVTLNATILARAVATLNMFHVDTFLTPSVIHHNTGQTLFFIDQSSLYYPIDSYNKTGEMEMEAYMAMIVNTLSEYFRLIHIIVNNNEVMRIAKEIIALEVTIAREYSAREKLDDDCYSTNKCYIDNFSIYSFIDLNEYFRIFSDENKFISHYFASNNHPVLARKYIMQKFENNFTKAFKPEVIVNYMFYRLIMSRRSYILSGDDQCNSSQLSSSYPETNESDDKLGLRSSKFDVKKTSKLLASEQSTDDYNRIMTAKWKCLQRIKNDIPEIADRFDIVTISNKQRDYLDRYLNDMLRNIKISLINMLRLTFADDDNSFDILKDELSKVKVMVRYPTNINDEVLNSRYKELNINEFDNFYEMREKLLYYSFQLRYELLSDRRSTTIEQISRGLMSADDILYDYVEHKIVIAFTLLKRPFFDVDWPESVIYATLGFVIGHELIHSITDMNQRYPWINKLNSKNLLKKQREMEECVTQQYRNYCPVHNNTKLKPRCVDGSSSYAENMADNGGLTAAYLAYQTRTALYGRDPQLPHPVFSKLTHEQLFFMGFAQTFCHRPLSENEWAEALLVTPTYSPQKYRVIGSLENFAAFKNAFNCPVVAEDEAKRCYTWIPKFEDSLV